VPGPASLDQVRAEFDADDRSASTARQQAKRLIASANELLAIARQLERHAEPGTRETPLDRAREIAEHDDPLWAELARQAYRDRRRRNEIFQNESLFGEPAWDILLDLFIASKERKLVPVTSACIGAAVPPTTALRWLQVLEKEGLVVRECDTRDARRVFVRLSAEAYARMVAYFNESSRPLRNEHWDTVLLPQEQVEKQRALAGGD
jgi:hypothetical protein